MTHDEAHAGLRYPLVECDRHPDMPLSGYAVCRCIVYRGRAVAVVDPASGDALGAVLCARCLDRSQREDDGLTADDLALMCSRCALEQGILVIGATIKEKPRKGKDHAQ